jgi:6-phosphofructokinase 1
VVIGLYEGKVRVVPLREAEELADWEHRRPRHQWWLELRPLVDVLASRLAAGQAG